MAGKTIHPPAILRTEIHSYPPRERECKMSTFWKRVLIITCVAVPTVPIAFGAIMGLFYGVAFTTIVPSSIMDNVQRLEDVQAASNAKVSQVYVVWGAGDLLPDPNRDNRDQKPDEECKNIVRQYIQYQVVYWAAVAMPVNSSLFKGAGGLYSHLDAMEYQEEGLNYTKHPDMG